MKWLIFNEIKIDIEYKMEIELESFAANYWLVFWPTYYISLFAILILSVLVNVHNLLMVPASHKSKNTTKGFVFGWKSGLPQFEFANYFFFIVTGIRPIPTASRAIMAFDILKISLVICQGLLETKRGVGTNQSTWNTAKNYSCGLNLLDIGRVE